NIPNALYPDPNWRAVLLRTSPSWQFDFKLDHQITNNNKISGRYSRLHNHDSVPTLVGDGDFGPEGDGVIFDTTAQNGGAEYNWAIAPTVLLTSRFSVDRVHAPGMSNNYPTLDSVGLNSVLTANGGLTRMPTIGVDDSFLSLFDQCCVDTHFAHTLINYSSALQWVKGAHSIKFGGEQRAFFNYFWQPDNPTGIFNFSRDVTTSQPNAGLGNSGEGNPFATILLGYPHDASLHLVPAVADKSKETAFFVQDDWKATPKLTLNLGLRYEWSTPYTERFNRLQFNDFTGDTGINIPVNRNLDDPSDPNNPQIDFGQIGEIRGTSMFANSSRRNSPVDRNNFAPRFGFAYQLAS
ncbi:MAG: TonB-dependent receptor, partial [Acidobacteriales bacterium]|nr:TonB-dependent receptor [Terriglobales bacterium]